MPPLTPIERYFSNNRANHVFNRRPGGVKGSIGAWEARFLHAAILESTPRVCVEIGTGSGVSSAIIANALSILQSVHGGNHKLHSLDAMEFCWYDKDKRVGFFLGEFASELTRFVEFRTKTFASQLKDFLKPVSIEFFFIDANHKHPWPALDLLASLPYLRPDAQIMLHDINLPFNMPEFPDSNGARVLFNDLMLDKSYVTGHKPELLPNMGLLRTAGVRPNAIERQVRAIIENHPWEIQVPDAYLASLGIARPA